MLSDVERWAAARVKVFNVEQGSPEWFDVRKGCATASEFHTVTAKGRGGTPSVTRRKYAHRLAGEIITGLPEETYSNPYMDRGKLQEAEARDLYGFITGHKLHRVGFVKCGPIGCSPDALTTDDNGVLEVKTAMPSILIEHIRNGDFPPEHYAQAQGNIWLTNRQWCDLAIYSPKMPLHIVRTWRDDDYLSELSKALRLFLQEVEQIVTMVQRYGGSNVENAALRLQLQDSVDTSDIPEQGPEFFKRARLKR